MTFRRRREELLTGLALDIAVQQRAQCVLSGTLTRDDFLEWMHANVTHEGPEKYLDLVEMACVPEEADAGAGRWWRESDEAAPLREWTHQAINAVAHAEQPTAPPDDWEKLIYSK